jgi:hypothetical protein
MIILFAIVLMAVSVMAYRELRDSGDLKAIKEWVLALDRKMDR